MLRSELLDVSSVSVLSTMGEMESSISFLCSNNFLLGGFHPRSAKALKLELTEPKDLWKTLLMRGIMSFGPIAEGKQWVILYTIIHSFTLSTQS